MKVLFYCCGSENLGVEALSAYLKKKGHEVELLFDPQPGNNFYFNVSWLNAFIDKKKLIKKAVAFNPDLIAVSFLTNQFIAVKDFVVNLKKELNAPVIAGGFHATSLPEELIKEDWVDIVCVGDGEEALEELAHKLSAKESINNIKNLWVKAHDGTVFKNPVRPLIKNLDSLPIPDKSIFNNYGIINKRLMVMTSRGCPYQCSYCINSYRNKIYENEKYLRRKSVPATIDELLYYKRLYKPSFIQFYDDIFSYDVKWLDDFSKEYPAKVGLPFECYVTPTRANEEIIKLLKESGCASVIMGVQSGRENVRSAMLNRHYSNEKVIEAAELIKKYKIKLITEYIFGFPNDDYNSMIAAFELNDRLKADYTGSFIFYPFPQTGLTDYCLQNDFLSTVNYEKVKKGISSMHQLNSMINNIDKALIYKFYAILPLYNKSNSWFKKRLIKLLGEKFGLKHKIINILSIPLLDFSYVFKKIVSIPHIIIKSKKYISSKYVKN